MREKMMASGAGLRAALRDHTAPVHQRLDDMVGTFGTPDQYRSFVRASYQFRLAVEPACADVNAWEMLPLLASLHEDMDDLGLAAEAPAAAPLKLEGDAAKLGALYVLEGSALGARLLLKRAETLGFGTEFGARHLARQTADNTRWKSFLGVLDAPSIDRQAAMNGARDVFDRAVAIYSEEMHSHG